MGPEAGARGASSSACREPQHVAGSALEAAARREEVEPGEGRSPGALRQGAAGVGQQYAGAPPEDGEGERRAGVKIDRIVVVIMAKMERFGKI